MFDVTDFGGKMVDMASLARPPAGVWMVVGGALITAGAVLLTRAVQRAIRRLDEENAEWLARVMLMEAADPLGPEGVGVAYVALNRARSLKYLGSVRRVLTDHAGADWCGVPNLPGCYGYLIGATRRSGRTITEHPQWAAALALARRIVAGAVRNPIGGRKHFLHPYALSECTDPGTSCGGGRVCQEYFFLTTPRCVPAWAAPPPVGTAAYPLLALGVGSRKAVFSGVPR